MQFLATVVAILNKLMHIIIAVLGICIYSGTTNSELCSEQHHASIWICTSV